MTLQTRNRMALLALALGFGLLPIPGDSADTPMCRNATTSLASLVTDPVAGDEAFFKLPAGPSNVMLLIDVSGSMEDIPQCPDMNWGSGSTCKSPPLAAPTKPNYTTVFQAVRGTCLPATDPALASSELLPDTMCKSSAGVVQVDANGTPVAISLGMGWMESVITTANPPPVLFDAGRSNALLTDAPTWGTGCVGDDCLFDYDAYYFYRAWSTNSTTHKTTARRRAHNPAPAGLALEPPQYNQVDGLPLPCLALDSSGNVITDEKGKAIDLGLACRQCMGIQYPGDPDLDASKVRGFYFYRARYRSGGTDTTTAVQPIFRGSFFNNNPPKFIAARKVIKDVAWMDPATPSKLDQVRLGLAVIDSGASGNQKSQLVVPLGPSKSQSFPTTQAGFAAARQAILSVVNNATTYHYAPANGSTPMGSALFNVGQYLSSVGFYKATFGSTYELDPFKETAAGRISASWVTSPPAGDKACSYCWPCQTSSVVIVTDGMPNSEITFPTKISTIAGSAAALADKYNCGSGPVTRAQAGITCANGTLPTTVTCTTDGSNLARMAYYLANTDIRADFTTSQKQAPRTFTVSFPITDNQAIKALNATANMGGGTFKLANNARELQDAVFSAVSMVVPKENSFSAASANSLQTVQTASAEAFLTRFKPSAYATWEGHLFRGGLFDEFLNGCDPTKPPASQVDVACAAKTVKASFAGETDPVTGNATCTGVYLIDADCDQVSEDPSTGDFVKKALNTPANFAWDAGEVLSTPTRTGYRTAQEGLANSRNIFTYVPNTKGGFDKVSFLSSNAATLQPFMNIDATWCSNLLARLGMTVAAADKLLECTRQVIHFVRGWDVLNDDGDACAGPSSPLNTTSCQRGKYGEERDRAVDSRASGSQAFWKLGDIFHSSPAVVGPPVDEIRCDTGYEKQCVATLHSPSGLPNQTPIVRTYAGLTSGTQVDAYDRYRLDHRARKRIVLVGANDGMLHAFDSGDADTAQAADLTGTWTYTNGTGEELWAFIPPDLLPRLRGLLDAHQYMVDGSVMVRDVWVDADGDGTKQSGEFHTVAIFGERTGGTQYSALDVTLPLSPTLLWSFPKPLSTDARYMGQSWMDFAPRPPPIGPVRLASATDSRGFEERWVVVLNGGYDPNMALGRAVFMVDVWTGQTLWRYTDDDFKSQLGYGGGTSMFPVAAGVALMDIGDTTQPSLDSDGFFDTATWGDLGGNLFVARFHQPGVLKSGLVTNWYAARSFEQQRRADNFQGVAKRNEFFYMTANTFEPTTRTLRTYLGSANRERMMDQTATCGADNLMGCCRAGCTVTSGSYTSQGDCSYGPSFSCSGSLYGSSTVSSSLTGGSCSSSLCASAPAGKFSTTAAATITCGATSVTPSGSMTCDSAGLCSGTTQGTAALTGTFNTPPRQRFYGVWSYGRDTRKMFATQAEAKAFDLNRFTDNGYSGCTGPAGGTCSVVDVTQASATYSAATGQTSVTCGGGLATCAATVEDAGWMYEYGNVCPTATCSESPPWNDEKTGSSANVVLGCTTWGGFRPFGASTSTDPCSGSLGTPVTYGYVANYVTGTPTASCGHLGTTGQVARAQQRSTTAPPSGAMVRVTFSPTGQISYSTLQIDAGSPPGSKQLGIRSEIAEPVYWLEVPRRLHDCRHVAASGACD